MKASQEESAEWWWPAFTPILVLVFWLEPHVPTPTLDVGVLATVTQFGVWPTPVSSVYVTLHQADAPAPLMAVAQDEASVATCWPLASAKASESCKCGNAE